MSKIKKNNSLLLLIILCFCIRLNAQTASETSNPFSRYGIGELDNKSFAPLSAMGRATTAFENDTLFPVFTNSSNPASLSSLQITCFEVGGKSYFNFMKSGETKHFENNSYLSYISLGFPIGRKTGVAAGISPYSNVGYTIVDNRTVDSIGKIQTLYEGSGGLNQVYFGLGHKPFKNSYSKFRNSKKYQELLAAEKWETLRRKRVLKKTLSSISLGANAYWMFGSLNNTTSVIYPSQQTYFDTKRIRNTRVSDFYASYGALISFRIDSTKMKRKCLIYDTTAIGYHTEYRNNCPCKDSLNTNDYNQKFPKKFQSQRKKDLKITLGATASLPMQLNSKYTALAYTYKQYTPSIAYYYDTTLKITQTGTINMPLMLGFGMGIKKGNSLTLLADINIQNWSFYRYFGIDQKLKNSVRYALGFQYINNGDVSVSRDIYKKKVFYRGGLYYNTGYLDLKNSLINEYGISFGAGIPIGKSFLKSLSISTEVGKWGTTNNGLIENTYIRMTLGLTLNDRWFTKRVID